MSSPDLLDRDLRMHQHEPFPRIVRVDFGAELELQLLGRCGRDGREDGLGVCGGEGEGGVD